MILYEILHGASFGWVLTHKLTAMRDKEAALLVDDTHELSFGFERNFDGYIQAGIFSRVIHFKGRVGDGGRTGDVRTEREIEECILETYDDFFKKNDIDFSTFEAIFTSADFEHSLGVYLALKGVRHYFCEAARNIIKLRFLNGHLEKAWVYADVLRKYGAYSADNPLITPIFFPQSENPFSPDKEVEYFAPDVSKIPAEDIEKLCALWDFDPAALPRKDNCLVVCSSDWEVAFSMGIADIGRNDEMMKKYGESAALLHRVMIYLSLDYFLREGFTPIMKWHPIVEIPDAAVNLPGAVIVNRLVDIAFFNYLIKQNDISFEQVLSYGSSSVAKSADISENKDHLGLLSFVRSFHLANRVYVILKMIEKLASSSVKTAFLDPKWRPYADAVKIFADVLFGIKMDIVSADKLSAEDGVVIVVDPVSKIKNDFYAEVANWPDAVAFFPSVDVLGTPDGIRQNELTDAYIQRRIVKKLFERSELPADDEAFNIICLKKDFYITLRDFQFSRVLKYAKAEISLKPLSEWFKRMRFSMNMRVSRVLVTGGDSGLGLAVAKRLLEEDCQVCIAGGNIEKLREAQAEIGSDKLSALQWDVKDFSVLSDKLLEAASLLGGYFDGVVQSAGVYRHTFIKDTNEEDWDAVMDVNAKALFFIMQKACRYFQQYNIRGSVCNISSRLDDSDRDIPGAYAASKLLCAEFTRSFGKVYAPNGIVINGITLGDVMRDMRPRGGANNLLKRASTTDKAAETVMFLLSSAGSGSVMAETVQVNNLEL
jgi:NAD(P)-dependent dehydrogenase (short-subunit alcohol dehydrogenase family)